MFDTNKSTSNKNITNTTKEKEIKNETKLQLSKSIIPHHHHRQHHHHPWDASEHQYKNHEPDAHLTASLMHSHL